MHYVLLSMFLGALFGAGMAVAQSSGDEGARAPRLVAKFDERFKAADTDRDGALSRAEARSADLTRLVDHFDRIDVNRDGKVTLEEIRHVVRARVSI